MSFQQLLNQSILITIYKKNPRFLAHSRWIFICCLLALTIGTFIALFQNALNWVTDIREQSPLIGLGLPFAGLFIAYFYQKFGESIATGNHVIVSRIYNSNQSIPFIMGPFVFLATLITHLFGGSAGREGTALQVSASIADQLAKPFRLTSAEKQSFMIIAVAAGFGAVFGTVFAAAIFAFEFSGRKQFQIKSFLWALATTILADFITKSWGVSHVHYNLVDTISLTFNHLILVIVTSILFGVTAALFKKGLYYMTLFFQKRIQNSLLRAFIGGFLVIILSVIVGNTMYNGLGIPVIEHAFYISSQPYDFALKMLFTLITLSVGFKGGEVTPLFFIGATLGSALSLVIPLPLSLMAGLGFIGVFAAATKTPIASLIMGVELFGIENILYFALVCIISSSCAGKASIYYNSKPLLKVAEK